MNLAVNLLKGGSMPTLEKAGWIALIAILAFALAMRIDPEVRDWIMNQ